MSIGFGIERLGHLTLKFPKAAAVLVLAITGFAIAQFPHVSVDANILRVYRDSGVMYDRYERLQHTFGTFENDAYILARSPDMTDPKVIAKLRDLAFDLELNEFAAGTLSPFSLRRPAADGRTVPSVPEDMKSRAEVAETLKSLRATDPLLNNLITKDLTGMVMIMFPDQKLTRGKGEAKMLTSLYKLIARYQGPDLSVSLTGPPVWKTEMLDASISDQIKFSVVGFLVGAAMSLITLRSFWGALLATLTPFVSVVWVVGIITLMYGSFTFLTNIVTTLVLVIAFAESMYFTFTWLRLWRGGMDPDSAIGAAVAQVTPAAALTTITTMVSFATLVATQGKGIEEFGYSGVVAVATTFVALITFLPLALKVAVRLGYTPPERMSIAVSAPLPAARFIVDKLPRATSVIAGLIMLGLFYPHFAMQPRFDFQDFLPKGSQALETADEIDSGVGGVAPFYVRVPLKDGVENVTDADYATIEKVHKILEKHLGKGKVISAASFSHYADSGFSRAQIFNAVGPFLKRRFISDDGKQALVTGFVPTMLRSGALKKDVEAIDKDLAASGIKGAELSGLNILTAFASTDIIGSLRNGLTAAIIINIAVIGFAFRSWRVALVAIIPNFLPILGTELYLYLSGAGLQLTTVIALTIAFGIAVDDTIHFLATYLRRRQEGAPHAEAVDQALERIGPALVATTLILCAGTVVVAFSALPQVALFGVLTVLTLLLALLGDLIVLPSLLKAGGSFFDSLGVKRR